MVSTKSMLGFPPWMGWENGCSKVKKDNLERKGTVAPG